MFLAFSYTLGRHAPELHILNSLVLRNLGSHMPTIKFANCVQVKVCEVQKRLVQISALIASGSSLGIHAGHLHIATLRVISMMCKKDD